MFVQPLEDLETADLGHFQIQEQQRRNGKLRTVRINLLAAEVVDCFFAVGDINDLMFEAGFLESAAKEENIVAVIICNQHNRIRVTFCHAPSSATTTPKRS